MKQPLGRTGGEREGGAHDSTLLQKRSLLYHVISRETAGIPGHNAVMKVLGVMPERACSRMEKVRLTDRVV